jgi:hypothetical protein
MAHSLTPARYGRSRTPNRLDDAPGADPRTTAPDRRGAPRPRGASVARRLSIVSALLILAGGYVHFCLYRNGYRFIPKIGVSFLLQFSSSAVLAVALVGRERLVRVGRHVVAVTQLTRLAAIGLSVGTLAALGVAHTPGGLFQFREIGLRPAPQTLIAIIVESLATILLVVAMVQARHVVRAASDAGARVAPTHDRHIADAA